MAVYEVKSPEGKTSLVECRTQKAAINHVAAKGYTTTTLTMKEVVKRVQAGEQIETLAEDKAPAAAEPDPILDAIEASKTETEEQKETARGFSGRFTKKSA